ncbi:hypothetical protein PBY51_022076 [Eleginops maclovinus]|uniref:Uncharacterized protein n=1 Tax=Eleginops maclovinus TaxID=56733 RepID=A0AAN7XCB7_ELEMC|nr:hypothetical protein PBY51_022076 [Eleginops maclovinus]
MKESSRLARIHHPTSIPYPHITPSTSPELHIIPDSPPPPRVVNLESHLCVLPVAGGGALARRPDVLWMLVEEAEAHGKISPWK